MQRIIYLAWLVGTILLAVSINPSSSPAQITFERTYGGTSGESGHFVRQTQDGGYIVTGPTESFGAGGRDVYLVKTDSAGDTTWTRTYGGTGRDEGRSVQQTQDGGYIIVGLTESFGATVGDVYLIKTDSAGDTTWTWTYGGSAMDRGRSVQQTSDGGYIVAGYTESFGAGGFDVYLIRTDPSGNPLWQRTYGDTSSDFGHSVEQTLDGGYIIAGRTMSFGAGSYDFYLVKTDFGGGTVWMRTYGGTERDECRSVQQTQDGGYVIAGSSESFGAGGSDVWLVKTDPFGNVLWDTTYGGTGWDYGSSAVQTQDGEYIIAGATSSFGAGSYDVYLIKTDSVGNTAWARTYGGAERDIGYSVWQTLDGGYVIGGWTECFGAGESDVYLIKTDADGLTGVEEDEPGPPTESPGIGLFRNEPNPFRHSTTIRYSLPTGCHVALQVYDITGRLLETLVDGYREPGTYHVNWNGKDVSAGIYFCRLEAGKFIRTVKMTLVR